MPYVIRRATTPAEFELVRGLMAEYVAWDAAETERAGVDPQIFLNFYYGPSSDELAGDFAPPASCLLLATNDEGEAAGCVAFKPLDPGICELKRLFVRSAHRGRRLGRQLAEHLLDAARAAGYHTVRLETVSFMGDAHGLYETLGFRDCEPYYAIPPVLASITRFMALELYPSH